MLDVSRHFFSVEDGLGGFFTQAEFSALVEYARARYITVVPELDLPGHCHAALSSYGALTWSGIALPACTTVAVEPSSLCVGKAVVSTFLDDVVREVTALTPGAVFHVGGDEADATSSADYIDFVDEVASIVEAHGARLMDWDEIASASALSGAIVQLWRGTSQAAAARLVVSPYDRSYLGPDFDLELGYEWDPATLVPGIAPESLLGLEGPIWTEEVSSREELDRAAFPGLCGIAELGWSAAQGRRWSEYRDRLRTHGPRLDAMGVAFQRSALVRWE
jgi:hexosaminidase